MLLGIASWRTGNRSGQGASYRFALGFGVGALLSASEASACHGSFPDWRKVLDPAGYLFCAEVFAHFDSSGTGPEISEAEQRHGHACHLDCQLPGEGILMGHQHGITLPDGGCNIEVVQACQLGSVPETGSRPLEGVTIPDRPRPALPFDRW